MNSDGPVLLLIGKEEEVVNIHPRSLFIPQNGWTFLAAGIFSRILGLYSAIYSSCILPWLSQAAPRCQCQRAGVISAALRSNEKKKS